MSQEWLLYLIPVILVIGVIGTQLIVWDHNKWMHSVGAPNRLTWYGKPYKLSQVTHETRSEEN